jgi:lipoprotein-anchoring transpeptidase ErfK/SrfK
MPSPLTSLWQQGNYNVITKGAVMAFEQFNGLDTSGLANPLLWPTLINDVLTNKVDPHRYSWIEVNKILPQKLTLYENGSVVLTSLTNTGIKGLSTTNGTFPIYLRFKENYMSGTNPNGTTYHDHVYWINYFLGSEAVHGFPRAQYGFQQSLGCVELPVSTAATVYPQVHIGTLTTILPS